MTVSAQRQTGHRHWILIACMLAMFMAAIEVTIVATAMPTIIADLGGFSQFGWVFSIYLLTQAVSVPLYGRLADKVGRKTMFLPQKTEEIACRKLHESSFTGSGHFLTARICI